MTKRIISLFLVCILAIPIVAVPAYATNVSTSDDEAYHNKVLEYFAAWTNTWLNTNDYLGEIAAYCHAFYAKLDSMLSYFNTWNSDIFENFWAKMAAWLLVFWNGDEDLGVTGILPTINQGFSTVSGVLGTLDSTVNKLLSGIQGQINTLLNAYLGPIRNYVSTIPSKIDSLIDVIRGDTSQSDDFKDKTDDITNGMEDMPEVTYPDFEQVDTDISSLLPVSPTSSIQSFFGLFFDSGTYLYFVWTLVFTFSLMSFVLFGKR